ncbi:MAG: LCP family protein [Clostridia bacterium]|nr:LCP family protein [Clostridia bacterium]
MSISDFFPKEETTETTDETLIQTAELSGEASFLLACSSDEKDSLYFVFVVFADLDGKEIRVCPIASNTVCNVGGVQDSIAGHYRRNSERGLLNAVNSLCGFNIDRYAISTASQFKNAVNVLDGAVVTVPQRINHKSEDFNLSLMPGEQSIKGESLLKYFRYLLKQGGGMQAQGELLCTMISQYVSNSYLSAGRAYFSQVINEISSNITIVDFSRTEPLLEAMADSEISYITVNSVNELKPSQEQ